MAASDLCIQTRNLGKTYGRRLFRSGFRALDGVSLEVGRGMVFGLLGPNGAGKTTFIKILLGLVRNTDGEARLFGEPVPMPRTRRRVGYLPEAHRLPPYLTGRKVLELFGQMCGRERRFIKKRIHAALEQVGMTASADRKVREYSKGMQQRIGLAQALIHEPELVFLDEPTDGVDPLGRAAIRNIVRELKQRGVTVFVNSHLLMEVEMICDAVVIMSKGRILREGTIEELTPRTGVVRISLDPSPEGLAELLEGLGSGLKVDGKSLELLATDEELNAVIDRLRGARFSIRAIERGRLTLEQAFMDLIQAERS